MSRNWSTHHVGGYLKIAPEHTEAGPAVEDDEAGHRHLRPLQGAVRQVRRSEAGKEQYLIPYFIAAHPGTTDEDMMNLALWLKRNGFAPTRCRPSCPRPWRLRRPCITRA